MRCLIFVYILLHTSITSFSCILQHKKKMLSTKKKNFLVSAQSNAILKLMVIVYIFLCVCFFVQNLTEDIAENCSSSVLFSHANPFQSFANVCSNTSLSSLYHKCSQIYLSSWLYHSLWNLRVYESFKFFRKIHINIFLQCKRVVCYSIYKFLFMFMWLCFGGITKAWRSDLWKSFFSKCFFFENVFISQLLKNCIILSGRRLLKV